MSTEPTSPAQPATTTFQENMRVSWWMFIALGLVLGGTTGSITGMALTGAIQGGTALLFYGTFAASALLSIYLLVNFTTLGVIVNERGVEVSRGMFRRFFPIADIASAEPRPLDRTRYGNRAWAMLFVKTGVELTVTEEGTKRAYYISSRRPDELAQAVRERISSANTPSTGEQSP
ncbi:MAG: DUF3093 family protein [Dehalococcoidia bacterium]